MELSAMSCTQICSLCFNSTIVTSDSMLDNDRISANKIDPHEKLLADVYYSSGMLFMFAILIFIVMYQQLHQKSHFEELEHRRIKVVMQQQNEQYRLQQENSFRKKLKREMRERLKLHKANTEPVVLYRSLHAIKEVNEEIFAISNSLQPITHSTESVDQSNHFRFPLKKSDTQDSSSNTSTNSHRKRSVNNKFYLNSFDSVDSSYDYDELAC